MPIDDTYQRREILEEIRDLYLERIEENKNRILEISRSTLGKETKRNKQAPLVRENTVWRLRLAVVTDWLADIDYESSIRFSQAENRKGCKAEDVAAEPAATSSAEGNSDG